MPRSDKVVEDPRSAGVDPAAVEALFEQVRAGVERHADCGAQVAIARGGRVAAFGAFGSAPMDGRVGPVDRQTLFCVFSVTKAFTSSAAWLLLADGKLSLSDRVADHIPAFGARGKEAVTVEHLLTHTAGFPSAMMVSLDWPEEERRLEKFSSWELEWEPGSRFVYHSGATMWVLAQLVTQLSGVDYREYIRARIFEPLGLSDLFIGVPESQHQRIADVVPVGTAPTVSEKAVSPVDAPVLSDEMVTWVNRPDARAIGSPGGGAIGTAADVALFYQGVIGALRGDSAVWDPTTVADACVPRNSGLIDPMTQQPALRGLGLVVAGSEGGIWRGFAPNNSARAIGHMGAGGQVAWGDPETGISFAFVTNAAERDQARQGARGLRLSNIAAGAAVAGR
jgi:CubicO group peptidase (beta-lactamase class C family)